MTITVTQEEFDLIYNALNSHAAKMLDYANMYKKNNDQENTKACVNDAHQCYELSRKLEGLKKK